MAKISNVVLAKIDSKYCDYLRQFSESVRFNAGGKNSRPFVGILININECMYFAPLGSPKEKYKTMKEQVDFMKIEDGSYAVINFNSMIPVADKSLITEIEIKGKCTNKYDILLRKEFRWLERNYLDVVTKACTLYDLYAKKRLSKNVMIRCCNFALLEQKAKEYRNNLVKN